MTLTMGGIAALCFAFALALMVKKLAKRAVVYLMLIAGITGLGGALGALIAKVVGIGVNGASVAADRMLGAGVGGLIVGGIMTIFLIPHIKPKGQPPTRFTPWLALAWGSVAVAVGGVFAAAAGLSSNLFATGSNTLSSVVMAFFQGS